MREKRAQCAAKRHRSHWQTADVGGDTGPGVDARATRRQACGAARFGVRWSFLCLFWRFPSDIRVQDKAAEVSLLDAGATFAIPLDIGEAFGVRLSFLALWVRDMFLRAANHNAPMQSGRKDSRTPRR